MLLPLRDTPLDGTSRNLFYIFQNILLDYLYLLVIQGHVYPSRIWTIKQVTGAGGGGEGKLGILHILNSNCSLHLPSRKWELNSSNTTIVSQRGKPLQFNFHLQRGRSGSTKQLPQSTWHPIGHPHPFPPPPLTQDNLFDGLYFKDLSSHFVL